MTIRTPVDNNEADNTTPSSSQPTADNAPTVVELTVVDVAATDDRGDADVDALNIPEVQAIVIDENFGISSVNHNNNGEYDRSSPFVVSATKPPAGGRFGIGIKEVNGNLYISNIAETSPFWNTALRVGHKLLEINGIPCQDLSPASAASLLPQSADDCTTLKVMEPRHPVATISATATTTTVVAEAQSPPPPGAPAGGTWTTETYKPGFAKAMIIICCIAGVFFWPAFCFACCALAASDSRRVYVVNGAKYLPDGTRVTAVFG